MINFSFNTPDLELALTQIGRRAAKGMTDVMHEQAERIAEKAREYAPVDEHDLEKAIKVDRDYQGINRRLRLFVQVDPNAVKESRGVDVMTYALHVHEFMNIGGGTRPEGYRGGNMLFLGKKSVEKDGGRGIVGGKFLERAFAEHEEETYMRAFRIVQRMLA